MLKFIVASYTAQSEENSFGEGIVGMHFDSFWTNEENPVQGRFDSITEALKEVCRVNGFSWNRGRWFAWRRDTGDDAVFIGDTLVDAENCEASPEEVEAWKRKECRLWNCRLIVTIQKQEDAKALNRKDLRGWL